MKGDECGKTENEGERIDEEDGIFRFEGEDKGERVWIVLSIHFFRANTVRKYVGIAESTEFNSFSRPAQFKNLPLHAGNRLAVLSIRG
jgi:hypothetical protein